MMVATRALEECSASEISASEPIAIPTANLAAAMPPLAKIEIAATEVLLCWELMAGILQPVTEHQARINRGVDVSELQERVLSCPGLSRLRGRSRFGAAKA